MPTICLNMIVKNESNIILRFLENVLPLIDTYCICDTGSTDDTISIIETFFKNNNMQGKIIEEPFKNFEYNRNYSLKQCHSMNNVDYILFLDADMILQNINELSITKFKSDLIKDYYYILQGNQNFQYQNIRIIKNDSNFSYWGVTHEYIKVPDNSTSSTILSNELFIYDIGDGGAKNDKFLRDIRLLQDGLVELPNHTRYTFYLANSYKDSEQFENAINTYKKRILLKGWEQEVWCSYYYIGICYQKLNQIEKAIYYWLEGYNYYPKRIENLYQIIYYYRNKNNYHLVDTFYNLAIKSSKNINESNQLFFEKDIYDYKLDYEFSISGYYSNINNINIHEIFMKLFNYNFIKQTILDNVIYNYKFYIKSLLDLTNIQHNSLQNIPYEQNVVLYNSPQNNNKYLEKWFPFTVYDNDNILCVKTLNLPNIFNLISDYSEGININNEIWFITKVIKNSLFYYMFIVLDQSNYNVSRYSIPFTLSKSEINYYVDLLVNKKNGNLIISYNNNTPDMFVEFSLDIINTLF